jgi:hypothetical protein
MYAELVIFKGCGVAFLGKVVEERGNHHKNNKIGIDARSNRVHSHVTFGKIVRVLLVMRVDGVVLAGDGEVVVDDMVVLASDDVAAVAPL